MYDITFSIIDTFIIDTSIDLGCMLDLSCMFFKTKRKKKCSMPCLNKIRPMIWQYMSGVMT